MNNALSLRTTLVATLALFASLFSTLLQAETYREGVDYELIQQPGKVEVPGKIEVREFFSFSCPHCFSLESYTAEWKPTLADDVNFVMTPAAMRKDWEPLAHAYYVAEALGKLEQIKPDLFSAIHVKKQNLYTQAELAGFFKGYGVTEDDFNKLYNSFSVRVKVRQATALAKTYRLRGVPALVVNGKYVVKSQTGKTFADLLQVVNFLVDKERAASKVAVAQ
ncbi:thiol:disulfide interchange protein DsbA/DsbL [Ketobacter sp.]|uniref:thiol:disulfide interchange protein DsbA/DsbL n=1 Tax=Ketobacter sp. TaxID=2083498 RepID=UPI000F1E33DB|nr:thiol:disulfide interchange protein DsbA/DsbL [Ketobacter sp.]RLT96886.1 MAG: thiol:disulfide interchange protein DsbA/DsbL [Ketobacter sp.]